LWPPRTAFEDVTDWGVLCALNAREHPGGVFGVSVRMSGHAAAALKLGASRVD